MYLRDLNSKLVSCTCCIILNNKDKESSERDNKLIAQILFLSLF